MINYYSEEMQPSIAQQLAKFCTDFNLQSAPCEIVERSKLYFLDTLGSVIVGTDEASTQIFADFADTMYGKGKCTVFGYDFYSTPIGAALVNGMAGHAAELDDDHRITALHPGTVVFPTVVAMAQHCNASGETTLEALIVGYEIMVRVGLAFDGKQDRIGFHTTSTCGVFGATAAAGFILGLNSGQMSQALGMAGSLACGIQEWKSDGSWTKRMHAGKAAEAGITCAFAAMNGYTGPSKVFEGSYGFLKAFSGTQESYPELITANLGTTYYGMQTAFKLYACCRFSHQLIDAVLDLKWEHGIDASQIEQCTVRMYRSGYNALFEPADLSYRPKTNVDAQFSAPYIVAIALIEGAPLPHHFEKEYFTDNQIISLIDRIQGIPVDEYEKHFPDKYPTEVIIRLKSGEEFRRFEDLASGDPDKPIYTRNPDLFRIEIIEKFITLTANSMHDEDKTEFFIAQILNLQNFDNINELIDQYCHN